jgi:hypothetical protein
LAAAASHLAPASRSRSPALQPKHGEREHRLAVAAVGGKLVPIGGFDVVLRHAEPAGIKFAQKRHRLRVFLELDAIDRNPKGGEVMAGLKRAEGEVGLGRAGGAEQQRQERRRERADADSTRASSRKR